MEEQRGVWKSREVFGSEQRGVWPNTSLLNFKHLSALVFGRFPLVKFLEESGVKFYIIVDHAHILKVANCYMGQIRAL